MDDTKRHDIRKHIQIPPSVSTTKLSGRSTKNSEPTYWTNRGRFAPITCSLRKVNRFAPLNRYYIIIDEVFFDNFFGNYLFISCMAKKIYMCVYGHSTHPIFQPPTLSIFTQTLIFFLTIGKTGYSRSRFRFFIFEISGKPSFVLWRVTQFFYLLCSQFRQKASGWINKTLLLIKAYRKIQKWKTGTGNDYIRFCR
jgi:hypothetical protein